MRTAALWSGLVLAGFSTDGTAAIIVTANDSVVTALTQAQVYNNGIPSFDVDSPGPLQLNETSVPIIDGGGEREASSSASNASGSAMASSEASLGYDVIGSGGTPGDMVEITVNGFVTTALQVIAAMPSNGQADGQSSFSLGFTTDRDYAFVIFSGTAAASGTATAFYELLYDDGSSAVTVFSSGEPIADEQIDFYESWTDPPGGYFIPAGHYRFNVLLDASNFLNTEGSSGGSSSVEGTLAFGFIPLPPTWPLALTAVAAAAWRARSRASRTTAVETSQPYDA
jgi:hypothetical protein